MVNRRYDESFLEDCDDSIASLYRLWKAKCKNGKLPGRQHIDPAEMVGYLPHIMLIDVEYPDPRFRYRLVGTEEVEHRGFDPTGKDISEAFLGMNGDYCDGNYRYVAESGKPLYDTTPEPTKMGNIAKTEVLFLPLAQDGKTVNIVLVYSVVNLGLNDPLLAERLLA